MARRRSDRRVAAGASVVLAAASRHHQQLTELRRLVAYTGAGLREIIEELCTPGDGLESVAALPW